MDMQSHQPLRPRRQDTFDLRDQIHTGDPAYGHQQYQKGGQLTADPEHSVMEDSSDAEGEDIVQDGMDMDHNYGAERDHDIDDNDEDDTIGDYMSDSSSSLSIPNESIDFDLVYSLTNFAATVEGQASVVKGDSLFLMDDSNSYWWLVRVLKTQEVGYIPAENIETPFERLARLNRHRNVDLASATQAELDDMNPAASKSSRNRNRVAINAPDTNEEKRNVIFKRSSSVFRYPPAVWNEDEDDADEEWTESDLEIEDAPIKDHSREDIVDDDEMPMQEPEAADTSVEMQQGYMEDVDMGSAPRQVASIPTALQIGSVQGGSQPSGSSPIKIQPDQQLQVRNQSSQERLRMQQGELEERRTSPLLDPAQETGTRKLVITPSIARDDPVQDQPRQQQLGGSGPLLPSAILQKRQEQMDLERKRAREEIEAADEASRRRGTAAKGINIGLGQPPVQQAQQASPQKELVRSPSQETRSSSGSGSGGGAKLRKERSDKDDESERDGGKDKKKKGMFGGLFSRSKNKDKGSKSSIENIAAVAASSEGRQRTSDESGSNQSHTASSLSVSQDLGRAEQTPSPVGRIQVQQRVPTPAQQQQGPSPRAMAISPPPNSQPNQPLSLQVSHHASSLRDRDQQQQALYSEYLKRSPSSPPDQPSYATQPASLVMPMSESSSLTSSPNNSGYGLGLAPVNASYKTQGGRPGSLILTPALGGDGQGGGVPELSVIRVFAGRNLQSEATFKTVLLNSSTTAGDLVRQSMQRFRLAAGEDVADYYLTVKQVEGMSLRLKPDETPLGVFEQLVEESEQMPMTIKRSSMGSISSIASNLSTIPAIRKLPMNDFTDDSAVKFYLNREGGDESPTNDAQAQQSDTPRSEGELLKTGQYLSVSTSGLNTVEPERFSSPALRFAMQLGIYPEELPDNMVFDPHTEAIVFKETMRDRSGSNATVNPGISQNQRKKFFNLPKNITVAEVIELGLERFGILEGVVDGGDEVEDKLTKRRSSTRVRYTLMVSIDNQERELPPSSKVIDAFPKPPNFRRSSEFKRRSMDSGHLLGSPDDVKNDDPLFVLRRAIAYKPTNNRHHRLSAPLDELALSHLRDSMASDSTASPTEAKGRQPSKQEIIAAQRAASRANQKAVLSTQVNNQRGVDVTLPDKAILRSQQFDADNKMRYSYTDVDGETYDISDIVEEELKASNSNQTMTTSSSTSSNDLLSGAMAGAQPSTLINRVLDKIKNGPASTTSAITFRANTPSNYSDEGSRAATPTGPPARSTNVEPEVSRSRSATPTAAGASKNSAHKPYQPSIASVMSDATSDYRTAASITPLAMASMTRLLSPTPPGNKRPRLPKDDFGLSDMLAIIHTRADLAKSPPKPELDEIDKLLFGPPLDIESVHPNLRDIYAPTFQKMKELDDELDTLLQKALKIF